jgi:hypothetical protein
MPWQTIVVCSDCYDHRRDTDEQLIDRPVRLKEKDRCHDCGSENANIPIRVATTTHKKEE